MLHCKAAAESGRAILLLNSTDSGYVLFDVFPEETAIPRDILFLPIARLDSVVDGLVVGLALEPTKSVQGLLGFKRIGFVSTHFRPELYYVHQQRLTLY